MLCVHGSPLYQWDRNRRLQIKVDELQMLEGFDRESEFEVQCGHTGDSEALVVAPIIEGDTILADVPNILLQRSGSLRVFVVVQGDTVYDKTFYVQARKKPADYVYTETEVKSYTALDERVRKLEKQGVGGTTQAGVTVYWGFPMPQEPKKGDVWFSTDVASTDKPVKFYDGERWVGVGNSIAPAIWDNPDIATDMYALVTMKAVADYVQTKMAGGGAGALHYCGERYFEWDGYPPTEGRKVGDVFVAESYDRCCTVSPLAVMWNGEEFVPLAPPKTASMYKENYQEYNSSYHENAVVPTVIAVKEYVQTELASAIAAYDEDASTYLDEALALLGEDGATE